MGYVARESISVRLYHVYPITLLQSFCSLVEEIEG